MPNYYFLSQDKILATAADQDELFKKIFYWLGSQTQFISLAGYSVVDDTDLSVAPLLEWLRVRLREDLQS